MRKIYPVILAGGSGSRLWPLSRKSYPKQFTDIFGGLSLFQLAAQRVQASNWVDFEKPVIITNNDFRFIVTQQLQAVGIDPGSVLIEPEGKNTAAAIAAAANYVHSNDPNGILLIVSADHMMPDVEAFQKAIRDGARVTDQSNIITFGITPTSAQTGYGYLKVQDDAKTSTLKVVKFIEKPAKELALDMLNDGSYLWNAGIFLFSSTAIISAFKQHSPEILESVSKSLQNAKTDLGFVRLDPHYWSTIDDISIDYAVMEHHKNLLAVPFAGSWSDLGGWDAVHSEMKSDDNGVAVSVNAHALNCNNTMLRSENDDQHIVGIGLDNIIAVAMSDAVLVAHKDHSQDVKKAVALLTEKNVPQAIKLPVDHRPWGWFETLKIAGRFQVKRIYVNPGAALSLQSHHHRSEHWIVVEGTAKVTIDQATKLVTEGESVYIPLGAVHRMENPGKIPMVLIEVQTGSYLGEDDIIRYEDIYSRS